MKIIVDTCVWSQALRRNVSSNPVIVNELKELINEVRVQIIGPIRQELLSGIKSERMFKKLKYHLSAFPDIDLVTDDYEKAAEFFNICRRHGVQGSNTDFLICAVAFNRNFEIFTIDKDFIVFQKFLPIALHKIIDPAQSDDLTDKS